MLQPECTSLLSKIISGIISGVLCVEYWLGEKGFKSTLAIIIKLGTSLYERFKNKPQGEK